MPSFDVVSKLNLSEVDNAIHQAQKEIATRYDFKNTATEIAERQEMLVVMRSETEDRMNAGYDVLQSKLVRRGVSLKAVERGKVEKTSKGHVKQDLKLSEGIAQEKAKNIVKALKDTKLKVQASIQGDSLRVSGKDRDELQRAIAFLKSQDFNVDLQFNNFRD